MAVLGFQVYLRRHRHYRPYGLFSRWDWPDLAELRSLLVIGLPIAGTLFEGTPKIVRRRDFDTDFTPEEHMLVMTYADRPGLIGRIGTILGEADA